MAHTSLYPRKPIGFATDPYDCFITYSHKPTGKKRDRRTYTYVAYVRATSKESASSIGARTFGLTHPNAVIVDIHTARTFPTHNTRWNAESPKHTSEATR